MYGHERIQASPIHQKDIVGVKVDFDEQRIYFYLNDKLQGHLTCDSAKLVPGKVYPCVNLGKASH
jgi:hypothetical protein